MEKIDIVGEPMTAKEFGQLLKDMYKEDEDGIPMWKKIFGVKDEVK